MTPRSTLAIAGVQHAKLHAHLFPGDGREAAAILLCAEAPAAGISLVVRKVLPVAYDDCEERTPVFISWPGGALEHALDSAEAEPLSIILAHSHPGGSLEFSEIDDASDRDVIGALHQAFKAHHGTAIMAPCGTMRARIYGADLSPVPVDLVRCAGDDVRLWWWNDGPRAVPRPTAYVSEMTAEVNRMHAVVIGASGTGSITAELAARLGFGTITSIDFDVVEDRNLNRILNTSKEDAEASLLKVDVVARAIESHRGPGVAKPIPLRIETGDAILAAGQADVIFSCTDRLAPRMIADRIASTFLIPLIDVGVAIGAETNKSRTCIVEASGRVDYVQPGGASLADRGVYTPEQLRAEELRDLDPKAFAAEVEAGYISGLTEEAPAVISLNMRAASMAVEEFIHRAFPYRLDGNRSYARQEFALASNGTWHSGEDTFSPAPQPHLGQGLAEPLLGLSFLQSKRMAAE